MPILALQSLISIQVSASGLCCCSSRYSVTRFTVFALFARSSLFFFFSGRFTVKRARLILSTYFLYCNPTSTLRRASISALFFLSLFSFKSNFAVVIFFFLSSFTFFFLFHLRATLHPVRRLLCAFPPPLPPLA